MTTANPSHSRPGGPAQAWRSIRRWQRSRPFWGGLFTALAGIEMFASTRMTLNGLSFHSGATGLLSLLIPVILVSCGLLLWFSPAQRLFYSVVAAVTAVYSLIGLNLGGFFVGLLLGMVGSSLAFAWTPTTSAAPAEPETAVAERVPVVAEPQPVAATESAPVAAESAGADPERAGAVELMDDAEEPRHQVPQPRGVSDPRYFAVALLVLGLAATGLVATQSRPVQAAPAQPGRAAVPPCPTRSKAAKPAESASRGAPAASPTPTPTKDGNIITDILEGIGDLLTGGGRRTPTPSPSVTPTPTASARPTATAAPTVPTGRPGSTACPGASTPPAHPGTVEAGKPLPRIAADPGQPQVARKPSKLTGSSLTMTGLRFEGITDLPTDGGSLKVLKFSMRKAVTDDFLLRADGPQGLNQRYATDRLTVQGDVAFYTTRFVGRLLGIKITLTPDLPFPDGIPVTSPIPVTFTDPAIDLAFVTTDTLTARPALALSIG
ncbi:DUF6114 domain-containing protein [Micromonospora sp. NPDC048909]|uniref:DUF6114 domain-containing protein n=1 Tax=Micromonospora sp. NPDC048909 TaxID=3155643 RepID=UPI0033F76EAB